MSEQYYQEKRADLRRKLLEDEIINEIDVKKNLLRRTLWEKRYTPISSRSEDGLADGYIRVIMSMKYSADNVTGWFGTRGVTRELKGQLEKLGFYELLGMGAEGEELLLQEWKQAFSVYFTISRSDPHYTSALMGMMNLSEDKIDQKMARDTWQIADYIPEFAQMKELEILSQSAREALGEHYEAAYHLYEELVKDSGNGNTNK